MKRKFSQLTKVKQKSIERQYHQMAPEEFDSTISQAGKKVVNRSATKRKNGTSEKRRAA